MKHDGPSHVRVKYEALKARLEAPIQAIIFIQPTQSPAGPALPHVLGRGVASLRAARTDRHGHARAHCDHDRLGRRGRRLQVVSAFNRASWHEAGPRPSPTLGLRPPIPGHELTGLCPTRPRAPVNDKPRTRLPSHTNCFPPRLPGFGSWH